jgi:hypothetical protein
MKMVGGEGDLGTGELGRRRAEVGLVMMMGMKVEMGVGLGAGMRRTRRRVLRRVLLLRKKKGRVRELAGLVVGVGRHRERVVGWRRM